MTPVPPSRIRFGWVVFALMLTAPLSAYAYIDPGTGSVLVQGLIGAVAAGAFAIKGVWQRFTGRKVESEEESTPYQTPSDRDGSNDRT